MSRILRNTLRTLTGFFLAALIFSQANAQAVTYSDGSLVVEVFKLNPCEGGTNGALQFKTISTSNGSPAQLQLIIGPPNLFAPQNIPVGSTYTFGSLTATQDYEFVIADPNGTDFISTFGSAIVLTDLPTINILDGAGLDLTNSNCTNPDGQIAASITGGSLITAGGGSFTYTWSTTNGLFTPIVGTFDGTTTLDLATIAGRTGLPGGDYKLDIKDNYSQDAACVASKTWTVTDPQPALQAITNGGPMNVCAGSGIVIQLGGSEPGVIYEVLVNGVFSGVSGVGTGSPITINVPAGTFSTGQTIVVRAVLGACSPRVMTGFITPTIVPLPTATTSGGGTVCSGAPLPSVTFTFTGAPPFNFTYTINGVPTTITNHNLTTFVLNPAPSAGTYLITALSDASSCGATTLSGSAVVNVLAASTASAGPDQTICSGTTATLAGSVGGSATGGTWSGGTGTFAPNATTLNAVYTPSAAERTAGTVTLTLTTTGPCAVATDQVTITIDPVATANAGPDQTICAGTSATLAGTVGGSATGGTWSGGTGTFAPNANTLNATYTPSAAEVTAGTVTLTLTTTGPCATATDNVIITITPAATVNAGPDQTVCSTATVTLAGTIGGSATGGTWSGGTGTFAPNANTLNAVYTPSAAEKTAGTVTLTLTTTGPCAVATDQVTITINPVATVNAGPDQTICAGNTVTLAGTVGGSATGGTWSGGTGSFAPNATTLNAVYTPSAAERTAGTVTLTLTTTGPCATATDNVTITITPAATVNAGPDQTVCSTATVTLAGTIGGSATGATWSGGTGTFAPNANTLNAVYTPSAAEKTAGTVTLTLTTTGPCAVQTDNMTITINPVATVNAGPDQTICSGTSATLAGTVGGSATGGTWSGGTGTFAPNATTLNAVYTPSAAERTAGTVTLTLTTTGPCAAATDNITITITPVATVNAGPDQTICSAATVTLAGTIGGSATSATWSGGTGTFAPNATTLNATYTPSAAEVTAGTVTLTLTTSGPCAAATDNVTITISPNATANAGPDQTICSGTSATLAGSVGGSATGGTWSGGTGTFAPNANALNATYTPSAAERTAGTVTLTLTTTGPCNVATDNVTITITPVATVNAGPDQTICAGNTVTLAGTVSGSATGGTWSGGTGTFAPNATTLNATYTPSAAERTAGTVTLTLTTAGPCAAVTDNVTITITPAATVNAGPDQTICSTGAVTLAGTIGGSATGATWSGGTGTFAPNATTLNATYTPSAAEITAGTVTLTLTTSGPCAVQTDNVTITISPVATVNAGPDQTICAGTSATLAGTVGGSATGGTWSGGTGTFAPNATTLNATYTPSAAERTAGTVTLTLTTSGPCAAVTDNVTITITPAATVNAGPDQTICSTGTVLLAGTIGGSATGATWSGGTGTFAPNATTLNATYTPSAAEVTAGAVTLTLTTSGPCAAVTDNLTITISPDATANAGADQIICTGNTATLAGSVGGSATGGTWSGGTGTFTPNASALNATYTPSAAEITAGTVTLTLTTTGPCNVATDDVTITISNTATANAGPDQSICAGSTVTLAGAVTGATGGVWTGGAGSFAPSATDLNAVYTPSAAEVTAGTVTLTLTSTGVCAPASDDVIITIGAPATANAGPDQSVCGGTGITLAGVVGGSATGGTWIGGTGTFVPNANDLNAVYTPSAAENTAGSVTLTLSTTGGCNIASDAVTITLTPSGTVNAGPDQVICVGNTATLAGTIGGAATAATWSGGTGTFSPNANDLNATYTLSPAEVTAGSVTLTLTTTGTCAGATDNVTLMIDVPVSVDPGMDQTICAGATVTLAGNVGAPATGGTWSGGTGTFAPDANTLNATYTPSAAEVAAGSAVLTLTANGSCSSNQMTITINGGETVALGPDISVCEGNVATLTPTITGTPVSVNWTGGTGTFTPDANTANITYLPSAAETTAGTVTLTLQVIGTCSTVTDAITITITPAVSVDGGADQLICSTDDVTLAGTVTGPATNVRWVGGAGTFNPNRNSVNVVYTPDPAEVTAGTVTLTLTADDPDGPAGPCSAPTDDVVVTISSGALVSAGADETICVGQDVNLNATFAGTTGITWTTAGDGTFNDPTLANAVYTPGTNDLASGTVTLTVTSAGPCAPASDVMTVTINPVATVTAGPPQTVCSTSPITLAGSFGGSATGLIWTGGDGTFADDTDPNTLYTAGPNDILSGTVVLIATATGSCPGISAQVTITLDPAAIVNAGPDQQLCGPGSVALAGSVTGAITTGTWTGGTTAGFNPNRTALNATYTPTAAEITAGSITLTLTSGDPVGACLPTSDAMTITIGALAGDQTSFGADTWIGYVYNDAASPAPPVTNIDFNTTKYKGFIDETDIAGLGTSTYNTATDAFDLNLGSTSALAGPNVCGSYLNDFSVRFKMRKTFTAGIYTFTVGGDDGVRLFIDGNPVAGAFALQTYTEVTGTACLTAGAHDIVIEYFEHDASSRVSFNYTPAPAPVAAPASICLNSPTAPTLTATSTDTNVTGFTWYSDAALTNIVGSGTNFTPTLGTGTGELDVTTVGTTTYYVTPVYPCAEGPSTAVAVNVVNGATLIITDSSVCESGGIVDLTTFVSPVPPGGTFTFTGHPNIAGNNFDPAGLSGPIAITVNYSLGTCAAAPGTLTLTITNGAVVTVPAAPTAVCQNSGIIDLTTLVSASPGGGTFVFSGSAGITGNNFNTSLVTGSQTILVDYSIGGACAAAQEQFVINVVATPILTTNNTTTCPTVSVNLLGLVSAAPAGGTFIFTGPGVTGTTFNPAAFAGTTANVNVQYNSTGCNPTTGIISIVVRTAGDPACGGGGGTDCGLFVVNVTPTLPDCNDPDTGILRFDISRLDGTPSNFEIVLNGPDGKVFTVQQPAVATFPDLKAGNYTYTVTDLLLNKVCGPKTYFLDLKTKVHILDAPRIVTDVTCYDGHDGNVTLSAEGSTTGQYWFTYVKDGLESPAMQFNPGAPLPDGLPADDDDFIIIKVDESSTFSCPDTAMVRIRHLYPKIDFTPSATNVTTCNGLDGKIQVASIGGGNSGTTPLQVRLRKQVPFSTDPSGFITVSDFETATGGFKEYEALSQGNYIVDVKDVTDCIQSKSIAVQAPGQVPISVISIFKTDADCSNNGESGSIRVTITDPGQYQVAVSTDQVNTPPDDQFIAYNSPSLPYIVFNNMASGTYFLYVKSNATTCPTRTEPIVIGGIQGLNGFEILSNCDNVNLTVNNLKGQTDAPFEIQVFSNNDKFFMIDKLEATGIPIGNSISFVYSPSQHLFLNEPGTYRFVMVQTQTTGATPCTVVSDTLVYDVSQQISIALGTVKPSFPDPKRTGSIEIDNIIGGTRFVSANNEFYYEVSLSIPADNITVFDFEPVVLSPQKRFTRLYEFLPPGVYRITVRDATGCEKTQDVEIALDPSVYVPNIFTPNDDNVNDFFEVLNLPLGGKHSLVISNRWGNEVFKSSDYREGTFWDAQNVSDGIYYYRLKVDGGETFTGWVEIIRGTKP